MEGVLVINIMQEFDQLQCELMNHEPELSHENVFEMASSLPSKYRYNACWEISEKSEMVAEDRHA